MGANSYLESVFSGGGGLIHQRSCRLPVQGADTVLVQYFEQLVCEFGPKAEVGHKGINVHLTRRRKVLQIIEKKRKSRQQ